MQEISQLAILVSLSLPCFTAYIAGATVCLNYAKELTTEGATEGPEGTWSEAASRSDHGSHPDGMMMP